MPLVTPESDIRKQIISLVADTTKIPQLAKFIEHGKAMCEATGINLLTTRDAYLRNLITLSIMHDNLTAAQMLIDAGVDINEGDMMGLSPLHAAVLLDRPDAVNLLIANRADLDKTDLNDGDDGFQLSKNANEQQTKVYSEYEYEENDGSFMRFYGSEDGQIDARYCTSLYIACALGREEIFHKLSAAGAKLSISFKYKQSPLSAAARGGHIAIVKALLARQDVDVNFVCTDDFTALDTALFHQKFGILELLLARKAKGACWFFRKGHLYNEGSGWSFEVNKQIIELYVSKTIDNYLSDLLNDTTSAGKDMISFHFNYNTDVFCDFVRFQFTSSREAPADSNDSAANNPCYVRLADEHLYELLKILLNITINEKGSFASQLLPAEQRKILLADLHYEVGVHLFGQGVPAAYSFLKKSAEKPQAQHIFVNMLHTEIKLLRKETAVGLNPEMTLEHLKKAYPQDYAYAEACLQKKADDYFNPPPEEAEPALIAAAVSRVAKRHGSPLHCEDAQQSSSKVARQETEISGVKAGQLHSSPAEKR